MARELLGQIVQSLDRILAVLDRDEIDADALAGEVTTVFGNQRLFTDSVRDFYAYLAGILSRYDLGGEEYARFKELLLIYIDLARMSQPVSQYADLPLGGTDACVVATAERLGVSEIATIDHRHFTVVRPAHIRSFALLPS